MGVVKITCIFDLVIFGISEARHFRFRLLIDTEE